MMKAAGGGAWIPTDLASTVAWLFASGLLYTDEAGTDLVDTNNDPVGNWNDASDIGGPFVNGTASAKPTWLELRPSVKPDGGDILRRSSSYTESGNITFGAAFVFDPDDTFFAEYNPSGSEYFSFRPISGGISIQTNDGAALNFAFFNDFGIGSGDVVFLVTYNNTTGELNAYQYTGGVLVPSSLNPLTGKILSGKTLGSSSLFSRNGIDTYPQAAYGLVQTTEIESIENLTLIGKYLSTL